MNIARLAFAWLTTLLLCASTHAQDIENHLSGVVKIVAVPEGGSQRTGAGFVVAVQSGAAYILTASHVIEGDPGPKVEFHGRRGRPVASRVLHLEGGQDKGLALLIVDAAGALPETLASLRLSTANARVGEPVSAIGHPGGRGWQVINVNIAGRVGREISLSAGLDEGNSGGPLLKGDEVMGVVTTVGQLGYATPSAIARIYLEGNGVNLTDALPGRQPVPPSLQAPVPAAPDPVKVVVQARTLAGVDYYQVDLSQGQTAKQVCARVDKQPGRYATDTAVCRAFHPSAKVIVADRGDRAVTYCTGSQQGACGEYRDACLSCPNCRFGVGPDEQGGTLYAQMFTTCVAPGASVGTSPHKVTLAQGDSAEIVGYLVARGDGTWVETGPDVEGARFVFREAGREGGVVHVRDPARGVELFLDLNRKLVLYRDPSLSRPQPLYRIVGVE